MQKLAATLIASSIGVGWVSAGNPDQLNYVDVTGNRVQDMLNNPASRFPNQPYAGGPYTQLINPFVVEVPPTFIQTTGGGTQDSATWIRGWIEPPQTGEYTFWVSGSDDAQFYLSSTPGSDQGKVLEAYTNGSTGQNAWATRFTQKSRKITLTKGSQYYFELIQKTGGTPGGLAQLGWFLPDFTLQRPIPVRYAQRFAWAATCTDLGCSGSWTAQATINTPVYNRGPGGATAGPITLYRTENTSLDLTPWISANYPVSYQWYRDGAPIAGDIISAKYIEKVTIADYNNKQFKLHSTYAGNTATSYVATVIVLADTTPPTISFAGASGNTNGFNIVYSENVTPATATNKANYAVSGGVVIDRVEMLYGEPQGNTVVVYTTGALPGAVTVTVNNVTDTAATPNTIAANSQATVNITDGIVSQYFFGAINGGDPIGGVNIADLLAATNRYPNNPDWSGTSDNMGLNFNGSRLNFGDNYGARLVGFVVPPASGAYNFVIAADDQAAVYLSSNADPANKQGIAVEPVWNGYRAYTTTTRRTKNDVGDAQDTFINNTVGNVGNAVVVNQSKNTRGPIVLTAGNKYYIEALMKEAGGGDNLDVTWQLPGTWNMQNNNNLNDNQEPIPGQYLSLFSSPGQSGPIRIDTQPASVTVQENVATTFSVVHAGSPSFTYQWYKDGNIVPDGSARQFSVGLPTPSDNGSTYRVLVRNLFSQQWSSNATLTVTADTNPPVVIRAIGSASFTTVTVQFDEVVDPATATNPANYSIKRVDNDAPLQILGTGVLTGAGNGGFTQVIFNTATQGEGVKYAITVSGVKDIAAVPNTINPAVTKNFTGWVVSRGFVLYQEYLDITGGINELKASPKFPNFPDVTTYMTVWTSPVDIHDNFGGRFTGFVYPTETGRYNFYIASDDGSELWLSNSSDPNDVVQIAFEPQWAGQYQWTGTQDGRRTEGDNYSNGETVTNLTADQRRYLEFFYKEGGGGDHGEVTWTPPSVNNNSGANPPANGTASVLRGSAIGTFANPDETTFTFSPNLQGGGTYGEGTALAFNVGGFGATMTSANPAIFWQWQAKAPGAGSFTNINGANGTSYTTPRLTPASNGVQYRVMAAIPGKESFSVTNTITIVTDTNKPTVTAVTGSFPTSGAMTTARVYFSEPVNGTATNTTRYTVLKPDDSPLGVNSVKLSANGLVATLTTGPQVSGTQYRILIQGIEDQATVANTMNPTNMTFTGWVATSGYVMRELYFDIGGGNVADLTNNAKFPNSPDYVDSVPRIESPPSDAAGQFGFNRENFGTRLTGLLTVPETADYYFALSADDQTVFYLSTDETPANKQTIISEPEWNGFRSWNTNDRRVGSGRNVFNPTVTTLPVNRSQNTTGAKTLTAGMSYYFELISKEGGGGDNCGVTWWKEGQTMPADNTEGISATNAKIFLNPDNYIIITNQPAGGQVALGENFTLSVAAKPYSPLLGGPISYQWRKGGVNISGATSASYTISNATAGSAGSYDVVMNAPLAPQATSSAAQVTVGGGQTTLAITKSGSNVIVTYPTANQAAGNQLQATTTLTPAAFANDTTGSDVSGTWTTTKSTTGGDNQTYWRTAKP